MTAYKKTTITVEVLSDGNWEWDDLADVAYAITEGECSGVIVDTDVKFMSAQEMGEALVAQGSDPDFLINQEGED